LRIQFESAIEGGGTTAVANDVHRRMGGAEHREGIPHHTPYAIHTGRSMRIKLNRNGKSGLISLVHVAHVQGMPNPCSIRMVPTALVADATGLVTCAGAGGGAGAGASAGAGADADSVEEAEETGADGDGDGDGDANDCCCCVAC
jgi:hypothetical protein